VAAILYKFEASVGNDVEEYKFTNIFALKNALTTPDISVYLI